MLIRAIALSVALLFGIGVIIPLATDNAEAGPRRHRQTKHYKKYSKKWWRQYRARKNRRRAQLARYRALRLRQMRLSESTGKLDVKKAVVANSAKVAMLPSGDKAPNGWKPELANPGELKFRVDDSAGSQVGSASISVVGPAVMDAAGNRKTVGGVSTNSLRREVINRMIQENGWVVNDYEKEIGGRQVYVVVAQSQAKNGRTQSRMFYFTEVDGRIYNVATNSPVEQSEQLADESEKVINSLQTRVRPTQRAALK
ncbi:MAG: hypothetical protein ABJA02_00740 [Acidobacteriota bacterium]